MLQKNNYPILFVSLALLILAIMKVISQSMTHDESTSFIYLINDNVLPHLFKKEAWASANNHYLSTLAFQFFSKLFGVSEFSIRFFSLLSLVVYLGYTILILNEWSNKYVKWAAFSFLVLNPYCFDFFTVARGYGPSLAFTMATVYHVSAFIRKSKNLDLILASIFILLASLSLFSAVAYIPAIFGALVFFLFLNKEGNITNNSFVKPFAFITVSCLAILALLFVPLKTLSKNDEFKWGSETLLGCFQSLVSNSGYSKPYVPNEFFIIGFVVCFIFISVLKFFPRYFELTFIKSRPAIFISIFGSLILLFILIFARNFLNSFYPIDRKTLMLIPFIGLLAFGFLDLWNYKHKNAIACMLLFLIAYHFIRSTEIASIREWWYDANTKEFIERVALDNQTKNPDKKVTLGSHWMFNPSLRFYQSNKYIDKITISEYNKIIDTMQYDYFMCFESDFELLKNKYEVLHKNLGGRMLLKKK